MAANKPSSLARQTVEDHCPKITSPGEERILALHPERISRPHWLLRGRDWGNKMPDAPMSACDPYSLVADATLTNIGNDAALAGMRVLTRSGLALAAPDPALRNRSECGDPKSLSKRGQCFNEYSDPSPSRYPGSEPLEDATLEQCPASLRNRQPDIPRGEGSPLLSARIHPNS